MEHPYQFDTYGIYYNTLNQLKENIQLSNYNCKVLYGNKRKYEYINLKKFSKIKLT